MLDGTHPGDPGKSQTAQSSRVWRSTCDSHGLARQHPLSVIGFCEFHHDERSKQGIFDWSPRGTKEQLQHIEAASTDQGWRVSVSRGQGGQEPRFSGGRALRSCTGAAVASATDCHRRPPKQTLQQAQPDELQQRGSWCHLTASHWPRGPEDWQRQLTSGADGAVLARLGAIRVRGLQGITIHPAVWPFPPDPVLPVAPLLHRDPSIC